MGTPKYIAFLLCLLVFGLHGQAHASSSNEHKGKVILNQFLLINDYDFNDEAAFDRAIQSGIWHPTKGDPDVYWCGDEDLDLAKMNATVTHWAYVANGTGSSSGTTTAQNDGGLRKRYDGNEKHLKSIGALGRNGWGSLIATDHPDWWIPKMPDNVAAVNMMSKVYIPRGVVEGRINPHIYSEVIEAHGYTVTRGKLPGIIQRPVPEVPRSPMRPVRRPPLQLDRMTADQFLSDWPRLPDDDSDLFDKVSDAGKSTGKSNGPNGEAKQPQNNDPGEGPAPKPEDKPTGPKDPKEALPEAPVDKPEPDYQDWPNDQNNKGKGKEDLRQQSASKPEDKPNTPPKDDSKGRLPDDEVSKKPQNQNLNQPPERPDTPQQRPADPHPPQQNLDKPPQEAAKPPIDHQGTQVAGQDLAPPPGNGPNSKPQSIDVVDKNLPLQSAPDPAQVNQHQIQTNNINKNINNNINNYNNVNNNYNTNYGTQIQNSGDQSKPNHVDSGTQTEPLKGPVEPETDSVKPNDSIKSRPQDVKSPIDDINSGGQSGGKAESANSLIDNTKGGQTSKGIPPANGQKQPPVKGESKPIDPNPIDPKPIDPKPVEAKPIEAKPVDTKPVEAKPANPGEAGKSHVPPGSSEVKPPPPNIQSPPNVKPPPIVKPAPPVQPPVDATNTIGENIPQNLIGNPKPPTNPADYALDAEAQRMLHKEWADNFKSAKQKLEEQFGAKKNNEYGPQPPGAPDKKPVQLEAPKNDQPGPSSDGKPAGAPDNTPVQPQTQNSQPDVPPGKKITAKQRKAAEFEAKKQRLEELMGGKKQNDATTPDPDKQPPGAPDSKTVQPKAPSNSQPGASSDKQPPGPADNGQPGASSDKPPPGTHDTKQVQKDTPSNGQPGSSSTNQPPGPPDNGQPGSSSGGKTSETASTGKGSNGLDSSAGSKPKPPSDPTGPGPKQAANAPIRKPVDPNAGYYSTSSPGSSPGSSADLSTGDITPIDSPLGSPAYGKNGAPNAANSAIEPLNLNKQHAGPSASNMKPEITLENFKFDDPMFDKAWQGEMRYEDLPPMDPPSPGTRPVDPLRVPDKVGKGGAPLPKTEPLAPNKGVGKLNNLEAAVPPVQANPVAGSAGKQVAPAKKWPTVQVDGGLRHTISPAAVTDSQNGYNDMAIQQELTAQHGGKPVPGQNKLPNMGLDGQLDAPTMDSSALDASVLDPSKHQVSEMNPSAFHPSSPDASNPSKVGLDGASDGSKLRNSVLDPNKHDVSEMNPSNFHPSNPDVSKLDGPVLDPSKHQVSEMNPSRFDPSKFDPNHPPAEFTKFGDEMAGAAGGAVDDVIKHSDKAGKAKWAKLKPKVLTPETGMQKVMGAISRGWDEIWDAIFAPFKFFWGAIEKLAAKIAKWFGHVAKGSSRWASMASGFSKVFTAIKATRAWKIVAKVGRYYWTYVTKVSPMVLKHGIKWAGKALNVVAWATLIFDVIDAIQLGDCMSRLDTTGDGPELPKYCQGDVTKLIMGWMGHKMNEAAGKE